MGSGDILAGMESLGDGGYRRRRLPGADGQGAAYGPLPVRVVWNKRDKRILVLAEDRLVRVLDWYVNRRRYRDGRVLCRMGRHRGPWSRYETVSLEVL